MIRGLWDRETVALMILAAVLPMAVTWLLADGLPAVAWLLFFLVFAGFWHVIFMLSRAQPPSFAGALTALAVAMLAPSELGIGQLLLGISFGVVMAELVFGGWGRNVLNAATLTLSFLGFGFPAAPWPDLAVQIGWAAVASGAIGWLAGVYSGRVLAGALAVAGVAHVSGVDLTEVATAFLVVLVLLVCDPVTSAATRSGRWLYGALYGGLVVLFAQYWEGAAAVQLSVAAALLASLAAPLLDEIAIAVWLARRRRRFG
ncbi:RnfABCDGE type electron transport complex subunit D [Oricola thermophila]|uniref:RnfABCDGE type electron transport complex subunit D n=1 Tax=Oricola thermophila TaxID=2742145 RepID=A0A6N1VCG4_9HYPH|nr:RnfABCDGE type electron transport complex subunit D [Oricola thermophila]QKV18564.1 RnfABCDGE type electron transport complex subunit D [Oricola thermophila]